MTRELNTLLTGLYVVTDNHVVEARAGRGRAPLLSDSELVTLAVAQILQGYHSERRWIRHIRASPAWRAMFPYLPDQSTTTGIFSVTPVQIRFDTRPVQHRAPSPILSVSAHTLCYMGDKSSIEWTEVLCTSRLHRKPFPTRILITVGDLGGSVS